MTPRVEVAPCAIICNSRVADPELATWLHSNRLQNKYDDHSVKCEDLNICINCIGRSFADPLVSQIDIILVPFH